MEVNFQDTYLFQDYAYRTAQLPVVESNNLRFREENQA